MPLGKKVKSQTFIPHNILTDGLLKSAMNTLVFMIQPGKPLLINNENTILYRGQGCNLPLL